MDYETAKEIYDKLVREKTGKGYTPGEDGTPYQHTDKEERATGILPQLLNPIDEDAVRLLVHDTEHCMQEKFDGKRVLVRKQNGEVTGDAEDLRKSPYKHRLAALTKLLVSGQAAHLELVQTAYHPKEKARMLDELRQANKEGVVFKHINAPYRPGRPNSGGPQFKHKFYAILSAVVAKVNPQRSVEIRLLNKEGWQPAGNVTIPANQKVPVVGSVVELRYLYAYRESGSLYQPTYLGVRQDVEEHECIASQLKFKSGDEDDA